MRRYPSVVYTEQSMREGMQIEDPGIPVDEKVRLLDALSDTGLRRISIGSFVHPKWVPQMAKINEISAKFKPKPGVMYSARTVRDGV